ncbi:efflux RND transporter periplasmic adaptor subunit [Martelella sp. HB161492]|uniref:efflux RND transporter periplasmic adaptor subunit n=1 Tax=Martelella sp. HB161492 TaxID=2720726 RepID=UPI001FEFE511|nr:efflux RND transporter periplasmic adaptor subunit [Martelella sp. HB161492]
MFPGRLMLALAVAGMAATSGHNASAAEANMPPAAQQNLPSIFVTDVTVRPLTARVIATGTIQPVEEVYVQPLVDGLSILSLKADIGDHVAKDAVLATLRDDTLILNKSSAEASKAKAEAGLEQLKAELQAAEASEKDAIRQHERAARLNQMGSLAQQSMEEAETAALKAKASAAAARQAVAVAEADIKVAEAEINDIALKLDRTRIKTPVAGVVSARNAKIGAIASGSGTPMFTIIRDGAIELDAQVTEEDVVKVHAGQTARITLVGHDHPITGKVRLVSPVVDETTRLSDVFITLDDPQAARAGMYARAEIITEEAENIAVPLTAVNVESAGVTVRKVEGDTVVVVTVSTGIQDGDFIEITGGLAAGDRIVARAGAYVRDGDRITPVEATPVASE